jgi:flagellar protein FlbD
MEAEESRMITVTRLNHSHIVLNSDLIEQIETTPDTVISLTTGQRIMVLESTEELVRKIIEFRRSILSMDAASLAGKPAAGCEENCTSGENSNGGL